MMAKRVVKKVLSAVLILVLAAAVFCGAFTVFYTPTVTFDAKDLSGSVTNGASGYLYGIAEDGVPSYEMAESLDLSTLATKTAGGLQHPIGEISDVANEAAAGGSCDYLVVYLQDMYDTWYYDNENITELKKAGTYNWKQYLISSFFPLVEETVNEIKSSDYHDKIVYCPFNECDNAVWFGNWIEDSENENGGYSEFESEGRGNFYNAWKLTYDYVKSLDPDAVIGGPGYYEYSSNKMDDFFSFTSANGCTPDIMIYHELNYRSVYDWQYNVSDLKELEKKYGISEDTPIIVTEYGMMEDNGNPNTMLKYITQIEYSKVYADQAYWLLANNLCNTAADYNTPNSAWWVYRWYADMQGETMHAKISDILHSDIGKAVKEWRAPRYRQFMGLGTIADNAENAKLDILVSGADYNGCVKIKNLKDTAFYKQDVCVEISAITYQGIQGKVYKPEEVEKYTDHCGGTLRIDLPDMNENTAYHIEVRPVQTYEDAQTEFENDNLYSRYEFENGTLLGNAYTYDSAYATTGEQNGMVGGMENDGDGVELKIKAPSNGSYELTFIYGNSNDGAFDENGRQNSEDRTHSDVRLTIDENESVISLENTIKSEITNSYTVHCELEKGKHILKIEHIKGTIVLDSLLVRRAEEDISLAVLKDNERENPSFLVIAPEDGYYDIGTTVDADIIIDGARGNVRALENETVYLRRGLNYIDVLAEGDFNLFAYLSGQKGNATMLNPQSAVLSGTAVLEENQLLGIPFINGISSEGGAAAYIVNAEKAGTYKMTIRYSNNEENGVHDYNVDLIEEFVTLSVNGEKQKNLYCRNTNSWDNFTTVTTNINLSAGENIITLYNDGANQFAGRETFAPHIAEITIHEIQVQF